MTHSIRGRSLLTLKDFSPEEIDGLLQLAAELKADKQQRREKQHLLGMSIALIFEKNSTRTRAGFEVAAFDQGAHVTYLGPTGTQIGKKETIKDTARVLGRVYDGIEYRGFDQTTIEELAKFSGVPVFNGLTDEYHPTQILADFLTMQERSKKPLSDIRFCYIGDARNNMGHSLLLGGAKMGMDTRICAPRARQPERVEQQLASGYADVSGAKIMITDDVERAVEGCDFIYTDVWVSMGEPDSVWAERIELLLPYQVNTALLNATGNEDICFMHCLPAMHNADTEIGARIQKEFGLNAMEVTEDVFESAHSIVFDQSENRMHTIKAVLVALMGED
jgi:ornithine carbamoyltransferase